MLIFVLLCLAISDLSEKQARSGVFCSLLSNVVLYPSSFVAALSGVQVSSAQGLVRTRYRLAIESRYSLVQEPIRNRSGTDQEPSKTAGE